MFKSRIIYGFAVLFLVGLPLVSSAADLRFGSRDDDEALYRVQANDQVRNLYAISGALIVDANSSKDTVAIGASVIINGTTAEDLIVLGGVVDVKNSVGGSVRVVGGEVNIDGPIGEDLVVLGGSVYLSSKASVAGDLIIAGGSVVVDGSVAGDIKGAAGTISINSAVAGDVGVKATRRFELGPNADIKGDLDYGSTRLVVKDQNAKIAGNVTYRKIDTSAGRGMQIVWLAISGLALLLAALLARYLLKGHFERPVMEVKENFGRSLLTGAIAVVALPILVFVSFISVVGFYIGIMILLSFILALLFAGLIGAASLGSWFNEKVFKKPFLVTNATIAIGALLVIVVKALPVIGALAMFLLMLAGLGATITVIRKKETHGSI